MKALRKLLFPFTILYGFITWIRNKCYDYGVLKSYSFNIPVICVGNLSVGGTGKTPQTEYLIRLLSSHKKMAVLSRGYQRKTTGFLLAKEGLTAIDLGDEPFQYFQKFPEIVVAVDERRVNGIQQLLKLPNPPEVILLDDAFQHRSVKPGLSILLTPFDDLFVDDYMLPAGNLREYQSGYKRADIVIVTRSPEEISAAIQSKIKSRLKLEQYQQLYFSSISYNETLKGGKSSLSINDLTNYEVLLITGIANPQQLLAFLQKKEIKFEHIQFADHHLFSEQDIDKIKQDFHQFSSEKKIILTTEKDYVRIFARLENCYFISIETIIINNEADFSKKILNYVG
ncbi:MAG: tetraacyldisaccharide 4'-kinase [Flavobacteriaceae bacterium]|nr:tetraacyldisaccharide 4'-kinase [Flavobacteriaceae bacterium]